MTEENQTNALLAITVVLSALTIWVCDSIHQKEITKRIIGTNAVTLEVK